MPRGRRPKNNLTRTSRKCSKRWRLASRSRCSEASAVYDRTELALNEGLGLVRRQFQDTSAATLALTVGTQARSTNENAYLQEALDILDALLLRGTQEAEAAA